MASLVGCGRWNVSISILLESHPRAIYLLTAYAKADREDLTPADTKAFSSLSVPDDMVTYLTRRGIYALAMGDEAMQVLNLEAVRSRQAAR